MAKRKTTTKSKSMPSAPTDASAPVVAAPPPAPAAAEQHVRFDSAWLAAIVGFVVFVVSIPLLARAPISGDGAEIVAAAERGGVLHPPGFPLQAWLGRLVASIPIGTPVLRQAGFCAACHAMAAALVAEILRTLGAGPVARITAALCFAFFPPVFALGTQPEVFAAAHLLIVGLILQAVRFTRRAERGEPFGPRDGVALGALVAFGASQHPLTVLAAPAFLTSLVHVGRSPAGRWPRVGAAALTFVVLVALAYGSLPWLGRGAIWPHWGDLSTASDIIAHALRTEYGTFSLMREGEVTEYGGLRFFAARGLEVWTLLLFLAPFAFVDSERDRVRGVARGIVGGVLVLGLGFLAYAQASPPRRFAEGILERFDGPAAIAIAIAIGLGVDAFEKGLSGPRLRLVATAALVLLLARVGYTGFVQADNSEDTTADVVRRALWLGLPEDGVMLTGEDLEGFGGYVTEAGHQRYPIVTGLLGVPWYDRRVVEHLATNLELPHDRPLTLGMLLDHAARLGVVVASTNQHLVSPRLTRPVQMRGMQFVAAPGVFDQLSWETVDGAIALCPFVYELGPLPDVGHFTARQSRSILFGRAFQGAAIFLERIGRPHESGLAQRTARALEQGTDPARFGTACREFSAAIARVPRGG